MRIFTLTFPGCALIILAALPAARAVTIDSSISRESFARSLAAGILAGQNFDLLVSGTTISSVNGVTFSVSEGHPVVTIDYSTTTLPNSLGTSFGFFDSTQSAMISFATPIYAFAIDINTFATDPRDYVLKVSNGPTVNSRPVVVSGTDNLQFIGFTSDTPFNNITISPATGSDAIPFSFSMDNLVYGVTTNLIPDSTVPEPSNWGLLAGGLALLALHAQRRRHAPAFETHARHQSPHAIRKRKGRSPTLPL